MGYEHTCDAGSFGGQGCAACKLEENARYELNKPDPHRACNERIYALEDEVKYLKKLVIRDKKGQLITQGAFNALEVEYHKLLNSTEEYLQDKYGGVVDNV